MGKSQPLVSCIIPVYNAEKYLRHGIESLLAQTYDNIEILLVDDRSTDASWDICREFAKSHSNVSAFRNDKNSGAPLRGRERGIHEGRGEWVTFMDCDDYVGPKYVEHLVEATDGGKYDIAVTGHSRVHPDGRVEDFGWQNYSQTTKQRLATLCQHFLQDHFWTDPADTVGQNLIRASVAKKTNLSAYPNTVWGEDTLMALAFLQNSKNGVNFVDHHDFYWRQRPGSGSHGGFSDTADRPAFYRACYDIFHKNKVLPTVSVVLPIYNVERYLRECVDSVLAQTYPNLEIVLVDDKSPDSSGAIADELAIKDDRIKVIHKPINEGLNMAHATGFEASSGEYVLFVDSDDLLTKDCVETALRSLYKNDVDFVRFGMLTFKNTRDLHEKLADLPASKEIVLKSKKDLYMTQFDPGRVLGDLPMLGMTVWGAVYARKLVDTIDWQGSNYRVYEDNVWTLRLLENVSSGAYIGHIGYLYRFDDSITDVLSKRLTGNSYNGKPVGYMECWSYIWNEYRRYNKKYKIGADEVIEDVIRRLTLIRASHLTKADLWEVENNAAYLPVVAKIYQENLDDAKQVIITNKERINTLTSENTRLKAELAAMQAELNGHMSIKRSAKLTLGNIKRRIRQDKAPKS